MKKEPKKEVLNFQIARNLIPKFRNFKELLLDLKRRKIALNEDVNIGLFREFRAYWWLTKKYRKHFLRISNSTEDYRGIDIIAQDKDGREIKFQISGFPVPENGKRALDASLILVSKGGKIYQVATTFYK